MEKYKIIKEKRKSLKLYIDNGEVIIKAPYFLKDKTVLNFIDKNRSWIENSLNIYRKYKISYIDGELFFLFGKKYPLFFKEGLNQKIVFDSAFFIDKNFKNDAKKILEDFYKLVAKEYIENRVNYFSKKYNIDYKKVKINSAKKRWASCSSKRNLNFSYRVIMAKKDVIDYIIIHEISHLTFMNHSKYFWKLVSSRCPKYKEHEKWLKDNYLQMSL